MNPRSEHVLPRPCGPLRGRNAKGARIRSVGGLVGTGPGLLRDAAALRSLGEASVRVPLGRGAWSGGSSPG